MTQEINNLVSKAIAAYYPYGLMCELDDCDEPMMLDGIKYHDTYCFVGVFERYITQFKPYLRKMSSMTKEELEEYDKMFYPYFEKIGEIRNEGEKTDFLNSHFLDYRGLIGLGLALEAPEGMYNNKEMD